MKLSLLLILSLVLTACSQESIDKIDRSKDNEIELKEKNEKILELETKIKESETKSNQVSSDNVIATAIDVMEVIKDKDMESLSQYIHPNLGVRCTPYFYVDTKTDQVISSSNIVGLMENSELLNWGSYDGSGEPIMLTFSDYYDKFIYDKNFVNPEIIGNNVAIGRGNTTDNVTSAYPNGHFIEFHFSQFDPQYEGIDWESLRLVFEEYNTCNWV